MKQRGMVEKKVFYTQLLGELVRFLMVECFLGGVPPPEALPSAETVEPSISILNLDLIRTDNI
jgi:hypothetical protein